MLEQDIVLTNSFGKKMYSPDVFVQICSFLKSPDCDDDRNLSAEKHLS